MPASLIRDVYHPGSHEFEVHHPLANKRDMTRWLAETLGLERADVTAAGDNHNDLPMFAAAGRRLAVANAEPEVRAAADEVLVSNDDDGLARYVARRWGVGLQARNTEHGAR